MDAPESSNGDERRVLVIEILDFQSSVSNDQAATFHFQDLAEANAVAFPSANAHFTPTTNDNIVNASLTPSSLGLPPPEATTTTTAVFCCGTGQQRVTLDHMAVPKWLQVDLCVIRLPHVQTDLLVTLSKPARSDESNPQQPEANHMLEQSADFREILSSLRILDWGLFGGE
jgi:hypothetical protein